MAASPHVKVVKEDWEGVGTGDAKWDNGKSDNASQEAGWHRLGVRKWREICAVGGEDECVAGVEGKALLVEGRGSGVDSEEVCQGICRDVMNHDLQFTR